ncbi:TetR/AcrR family transcriptional regulator [Mycolicibacterium sp. J2]|uniref:TetR/AcrR family transcriptional regulator n=1 Tax=Mycolicibacterium sp. J2 TaxID=2993511 RepID=UPI00224B01D3|nr:TetR/AcrR family transcriptional regulator [Mycolicibacterium sp. J2]MCX2711604.1 TetR/AcrR family transcriptional regulator [Mycolicibacterium sp. J2]
MDGDEKPRRLTRAESRERTRRQLLDAAAHVFARRGYAAASVEEIAESAGFSVGAVYSNFANKDELFAALMTDRAVNHMDEVADIFDSADALSQDPLQALGRMLIAIADKDLHVAVLKTEFWLHAVRNPDLMRIEADASARTLAAVREILAGVLERNDVDQNAVSVEDFATTTLALFSGLIRQRRIDPDRVSDALFGQAMRWQIAGMPKNSGRK